MSSSSIDAKDKFFFQFLFYESLMFKCKLNKHIIEEFQQHLFFSFYDYLNKIWYQENNDVYDLSVYFSDCDAKSDKSISTNNAKNLLLKSTPNNGRSSR